MRENWRQQLAKLGIRDTGTGRQTCPKCSKDRTNNKERCLKISYEDSMVLYNCHHCGFKGGISTVNNFIGYIPTKKSFTRPAPLKTLPRTTLLYDYMSNRGISKETVDKYNITMDGNKIIFPYYKQGELVNIKYRTLDKKFMQEKDSEKTLYGMDLVPTDQKSLIWVEGEFDVLSFAEVGLYAVSVPQGATEKKMEYIDNCYDFIDSFDSHIIAVDNDDAGKVLKKNLIDRLGKGKCKTVDWGRYEVEGKDANDFLKQGERGVLLDVINLAVDLPIDNLVSFSECRDEIKAIFNKDVSSCVSTGWSNLDSILQIQTGRLMIITGIPTKGKSFLADNLLFNLSKEQAWKHLMVSFESSPATQFRVLGQMAVQRGFDTDGYNPMSNDDFDIAMNFVDEYFYRVSANKSWDIDEILELAEYAIKRYGLKTLTVDPYNKLKRTMTGREDLYIDDILSKLSTFAKKMNILVIFVAHPTKPKENGAIPTMYSISGGSSWYNMADYGIIVDRDRLDDGRLSKETNVIIEKVKDDSIGDPSGGKIKLMYNVNEFRLTESTIKPQSHFMKGLKKGE